MRWLRPEIPALERLRQGHQEFEVILGYMVSLKLFLYEILSHKRKKGRGELHILFCINLIPINESKD